MARPTFDEYVSSLGPVGAAVDLLQETQNTAEIRTLTAELVELDALDLDILAGWVGQRGDAIRVLGLAVGLGQERLKNVLKFEFNTSAFGLLAKTRALDVVTYLDVEYGLLSILDSNRNKAFGYADVLVARAGTRSTAARAGVAGRGLEDQLEAIAEKLGLKYTTRGRFTGTADRTAPFDLAILDPHGEHVIVVAAKGFDSTGSKLSDAHREIKEMADYRRPQQYVFAAVDGIGWKSRLGDLRRIHGLWESNSIDGVYTIKTLDDFEAALEAAAKRAGLLPLVS